LVDRSTMRGTGHHDERRRRSHDIGCRISGNMGGCGRFI
jgi:hypothetical protein